MKGRKSILLAGLTGGIGKIRDFFSSSRILSFLSHAGADAEAAFRKGRFHALSDAEAGHHAWQYRFRRACLKDIEESRFLGLYRRFLHKVMQTALFSFGLFGLLFGVFSALLAGTGWLGEAGLYRVSPSVFFALAAIPLLSSGQSLGGTIRKSFFAERFLFGFCGIARDSLGEEKAGENRNWIALFGAVFAAILSKWIPFPLVLGGILGGFFLGILFHTPELITLGILLLLPFFSLLTHASIALCIAVLLADAAWLWKAVCGRRRLRFGLLDFLFLSFAASVLSGGVITSGGIHSLKTAFLRVALLSFWFPATDFFTQHLWRRRGIVAIQCAGFLVSVWGIGQYFFTDMELLWVDVSRFSDIGGRVCGPFSNPNVFAVFLVLVAPLFLVGAIDASRRPRVRFCNAVGFLSMGLCTVLTWSRGAWLGMLSSVLFILFAHSRASIAASLVLTPPTVTLATFLPQTVIRRFLSIGAFSESSIRYRFYTWKGVLRMIKDHAWGIGVGEDAFFAVYGRYALSGIETVMHAHQLFLQILLELGIGGLILFLFFLLQLSFGVCKDLKLLHGGARAELLGGTGGVLGALVMGLFDYIWYHLGMLCLFFAFCSLIAVKRETEDLAYENDIYL